MLLDHLLDITIDLLQHPEFKSFGDLEKSRFQHEKMNDDEKELRRMMYEGTIGDSEAVKKGHITRKSKASYKEDQKRAAKNRSDWYKDPENKKKFMEALKKRKKK